MKKIMYIISFLVLMVGMVYADTPLVHNRFTTNTDTALINGNNLTSVYAVNTLSNADEAISYANNNKIYDVDARLRLVNCENELKTFNIWSNVVDILPLYSYYNPLNGNTFMGRTYTNRDFQLGTFGVSNFNSSIVIPVPKQTNGTLVIVWSYPPNNLTAFGTWNPFVGMSGTGGNEFIYAACANGWEIAMPVTNGVAAGTISSQMHQQFYLPNASWNYDNAGSWEQSGLYITDNVKQRCDIISWNTNGNVSMWRNGMQSKVNGSFTNVSAANIVNTYSNLVVGKDLSGVYTSAPFNNCPLIMLFNTECNSNMAYGITRAARILDHRRNTAILFGDSLMQANYTNSVDYIMNNSPQWADYYVYNWSQSGMSAVTVQTVSLTNYVGTAFNMLAGITGIKNTTVFYGFGINDFGLQGESASTLYNLTYGIVTYQGLPHTKDFSIKVSTLAPVSLTNLYSGFGYAPATTINASVLTYNALIVSNNWQWGLGYYDKYPIITQNVLNTNGPGYSYDGLHPFGTNGSQIVQQVVGAMAGTREQNYIHGDFSVEGNYNGNGQNVTNVNFTNTVGQSYFVTNNANGTTLDAGKLYSFFTTNASYTISGFNNLITGMASVVTLRVLNNSGGASIVVSNPPSCILYGGTTNGLSIANGKRAMFTFLIIPNVETNLCNISSQ